MAHQLNVINLFCNCQKPDCFEPIVTFSALQSGCHFLTHWKKMNFNVHPRIFFLCCHLFLQIMLIFWVGKYEAITERMMWSFSVSNVTNESWREPPCTNCNLAPTPTRCEGNDTYNEDLSDNGFLARLGQGLYIVKVMKGRGYEGKPPNKPAVGYYDEPYGNDTFHLVEDTIRLGCKLGYTNGKFLIL